MNPCLAVLCAALLLLQAAGARPVKAAKKKKPAKKTTATAKKRETAASWFQRVLKIDPRAYANLTAYRQGGSFDAAPRLVSFDRATGVERTLWECGGCWGPAMIDDDIAVLRRTGTDTELWLVPASGEPRRIAAIEGAVMIAGADGDRVFVGVNAPECAESLDGPYALSEVKLNGEVSAVLESPCLGDVTLTAAGRVRADRYLGTTRKADLMGRRLLRRIIVSAPATGETPRAKPFDDRMSADVDRFDPVWWTDDLIVYVAGS